MARKKKQMVKLYTSDGLKTWEWSKWVNAKVPVTLTLKLDKLFVNASRRGVPWKCLLARGIRLAAQADRTLFPHKVLFVYVIGSVLYILIRRRETSQQEHLCVKYAHNFTKTLRKFDDITKAQFVELFGSTGVEIRLHPVRIPHQRRQPNPNLPRQRRPRPEPGERQQPRLVGAYRRAVDAGLIRPGTKRDVA